MLMRNDLGIFYQSEHFAALLSTRGQSAESPWRLALVLVMEYAEGRSDRPSAETVHSCIVWRYSLAVALTNPGFDYSIFSGFRDRLLAGTAEHLQLKTMPKRFKEKGLHLDRYGDRLLVFRPDVVGGFRVREHGFRIDADMTVHVRPSRQL